MKNKNSFPRGAKKFINLKQYTPRKSVCSFFFFQRSFRIDSLDYVRASGRALLSS